MSDNNEDVTSGRRSELKKLQFEKSQHLKRAKTKAEKRDIETKYMKLEQALLGAPTVVNEDIVVVVPDILYKETEISRGQKKKEEKLRRKSEREDANRAEVGDGSIEAELQRAEMESVKRMIPSGFEIVPVEADGDCLFTSVGMQVGCEVHALRDKVADYLHAQREEFEMFIDSDFREYCDGIRHRQWGSDIELEVISRLLNVEIQVYTLNSVLKFGAGHEKFVRISFHERQFTSCHYNAVLPPTS